MPTEDREQFVQPPGETWTTDDERILRVRRQMLEAENLLAELRARLNDAIEQRRATLRTDAVVCPVCGLVVGTQVGLIAPHASIRKSQCRGTGMGRFDTNRPADGGL